MAKHQYTATDPVTGIVATRGSERGYTHAVFATANGKGLHEDGRTVVLGFCGSETLALKLAQGAVTDTKVRDSSRVAWTKVYKSGVKPAIYRDARVVAVEVVK